MNVFKRCFLIKVVVVLVVLCCFSAVCVADQHDTSVVNRYNVVVVLDASGSMNSTDPEGFRFEAIDQFVNLLTEEGNWLGGIVFSNDISARQDVIEIDSQEKKNSFSELLRSVKAEGWTNTGEALLQAVEMLDNGDTSLPSIILLLHDGNTELGTEKETNISLDKKADALQMAREKNIAIYSVCLNANNEADVSEMQQLADATGGVFKEIEKAEDLTEVFGTFYSLIYGTSSITLVDDVFPDEGQLETYFDVPGIGVEEINILVYGDVDSETLIRPDGVESSASIVDSNTFSLIKESEVVPGTWKLLTTGVPGDRIQVNMIYNTNLSVDINASVSDETINPKDPLTITAKLRAESVVADSIAQYTGYSADLIIANAYGDTVESVPMEISNDHFEATHQFAEGTYYYYVKIRGNNIEKTSDSVGPLTVTSSALSEEEKNNTAPYPVDDTVNYSVNIWPFFGAKLDIDMSEMAKDDQGDELRYKIESTAFIEGEDFNVDGNIIHMDHFSLKKGGYTISATDPYGLSCNIEIVVTTHNMMLGSNKVFYSSHH